MALHPIDVAVQDGTPVSKSAFRSYEKERNRLRLADVNEVQNTDLSAQWAGIYVASLGDDFDYAAGDTTSAHNGTTVLVDLVGNRFTLRVLTSSPVAPTVRRVTAAGDVTVDPTDDIIRVDKTVGAATLVHLGSAASRNGKPITISDRKGDAATNNITFDTGGGELIDGLAASNFIININNGAMTFWPDTEGTDQWFTRP